jgi:hypothetical protein
LRVAGLRPLAPEVAGEDVTQKRGWQRFVHRAE